MQLYKPAKATLWNLAPKGQPVLYYLTQVLVGQVLPSEPGTATDAAEIDMNSESRSTSGNNSYGQGESALTLVKFHAEK